MNILEVLVRVLSPIISFTTEEVWQHYPEAIRQRADRPVSVQLAGWPTLDDFAPAIPADADGTEADFESILAVRDAVTKAMEEARGAKTINKSQEAVVSVSVPASMLAVVSRYDISLFEELFICCSVSFNEGATDDIEVQITPTELPKCPRCWNHRELGANAAHPQVCERCGAVLDRIGYTEGACE
jgi:isoleucyl-tRNA synthetase